MSEDVVYHDPPNVNNPEHASHHIVTPIQYLMVFGTLLLFTGITVGAAYVELGVFNPIVALAIACFKAVVVILFFMHVKYQSHLIKVTVGAGVLYVHRADHDDAGGLYEPRVGALVSVSRTGFKWPSAICWRPFSVQGKLSNGSNSLEFSVRS